MADTEHDDDPGAAASERGQEPVSAPEMFRRLRDHLLANPAAIVVIGVILYLLDLMLGGVLIWLVPGAIIVGTVGYYVFTRFLAPDRE